MNKRVTCITEIEDPSKEWFSRYCTCNNDVNAICGSEEVLTDEPLLWPTMLDGNASMNFLNFFSRYEDQQRCETVSYRFWRNNEQKTAFTSVQCQIFDSLIHQSEFLIFDSKWITDKLDWKNGNLTKIVHKRSVKFFEPIVI